MAMLSFVRFFVRSFWVAALVLPWLVSGCGGGKSASPPEDLTATAGDTQVVLAWNAQGGVDYWIFYAPDPTISPSNFVNVPNAKVIRNATSPQVITGLSNGVTYYFSMNGRTNNGPGGSASPTVAATPRAAGSVWTVNAPLTSTNLNGVTLGIPGFVTAGAGGQIFRSGDARTWTAQSSGVTADFNGITYINGAYVAVGNNGVTARSSDAVTWTNAVAGNQSLFAIAQQGSVYVAVGAAGAIVTSPTGTSDWTVQSSGTTANLRGIAYNGSIYVAVGDNGTIITSTDLVTWTRQSAGVTATLRSVGYGQGRFVSVGDAGTIITSIDGITWTLSTNPTTEALNAVTVGSRFIAAGVNGRILVSTDGLTWSVAASNTTATLFGLTWSGSAYVAVGAAGTNLLSF